MNNEPETTVAEVTSEVEIKTIKSKKNGVKPNNSNSVNLRDLSEGRRDVLYLDPRKIQVKDGFNVRRDYGDMHELRESIRANGVRTPLRIFQEGGVIYVESGHRRLKAVHDLIEKGVEIKTVPCIPEEKGVTETQRILGMILDNDGLKLKPLEEGYVFERLQNQGFTEKDIAERTGRSQSMVNQLLQLVKVPKSVQNAILNDNIASSHVAEIYRDLRTKAKDKAKNGEVNIDQIHSELKEKVDKAVAKAKEIGKTKTTRKIASEGTTKKTDQKKKKKDMASLVSRIFQYLNTLEDKEAEQLAAELEELGAEFLGQVEA